MLYLIVYIIEASRDLLAAMYYKTGSIKLGKIVTVLKLNFLLLVFVLIVNLYYRLSHSGKVCSGDFISKAQAG